MVLVFSLRGGKVVFFPAAGKIFKKEPAGSRYREGRNLK
jgi:hypothetical protein